MSTLRKVSAKLRQAPGPPDPANLVTGQMAVGDDGADEAIYYKRTSGAVITVRSGGGGGGGAAATVDLENRDTVTLLAGQAVQLHGSGVGVVRWDGTRTCVGLMAANVASGFAGPVQGGGPLTLSDWSAATGSVHLPGATMWADPANPGMLTSSVPQAGVLQAVGQPMSPAILEVMLPPAIQL